MSTRVHGSCGVVSYVKDLEAPPFRVRLYGREMDRIRVVRFDAYFMLKNMYTYRY
jgi:hypothetical protein